MLASTGAAAQTTLAELRQITCQLARLALAAPEPKDRVAWTQQLAVLTRHKEELEQRLAQQAGGQVTSLSAQVSAAELGQLQAALPSDAALIDFHEFTLSQPRPEVRGRLVMERRLAAFVVRDGGQITMLDLGPIAPIVTVLEQWRRTWKRSTPVARSDDPATRLRELLWQPLTTAISGAATLLISPDGFLNQLPFAALPGQGPNKYLLEEVAIAVVPVPRLLPETLRGNQQVPARDPSLLLVGAVDFDAQLEATRPALALAKASPPPERSGRPRHWDDLPGTREEVVAIKDSFEQAFGEAPGQVASRRPGYRGRLAATGRELSFPARRHAWFFCSGGIWERARRSRSGTRHPDAGDGLAGQLPSRLAIRAGFGGGQSVGGIPIGRRHLNGAGSRRNGPASC